MSRNLSPWGSFREEHGRLRLATPVTQPSIDRAFVDAHHARKARAWRALVFLLGVLVSVIWARGCLP